jgi:hypothetical protein
MPSITALIATVRRDIVLVVASITQVETAPLRCETGRLIDVLSADLAKRCRQTRRDMPPDACLPSSDAVVQRLAGRDEGITPRREMLPTETSAIPYLPEALPPAALMSGLWVKERAKIIGVRFPTSSYICDATPARA